MAPYSRTFSKEDGVPQTSGSSYLEWRIRPSKHYFDQFQRGQWFIDLGARCILKVYANPSDGPDWEEVNAARYHLLKDQLQIYRADEISWSIWLYKDIGFQGMVYV